MKKNVLLGLASFAILQLTTVHAQTLVKNMSAANSDVYAVYKKGNAYYIGGAFTYVGLNTGFAALTKSNNDYPNMDFPRFDGQIYSLIPDGSGGWYAGGFFTHVGGVAKSYLCHINSNNTVDAGFTANTNGGVRSMVKVGTRLYFGGDFTTVNGSPRQYAGAVNASTGALVAAWNPFPSSTVYSIAAALGADTSFWLGGTFQYVNSPAILRPYLARVNNTNGNFISGSLSANSYTYKITTRGDSVFLGGSFTRLGLKSDYLGSITEGATVANQTMPNANGQIRSIIPDGSGGWYVGGSFSQIGGINKSNVAHIKSDKSVDAGFTATVNGAVYALAKDGSRLYMGGSFNNVNSTTKNYLAAVNASTGALVAAWDPNANNYVYKLGLKDTTVLAVGAFTTIGGYNACRFAALNKTNGASIGGFVGYDNQVNSVALGPSDSLLTGGYYTHAAYYSPYSAKVTTSNVKPDSKFPNTNGQIYAVVKDGSGNYYVGGAFTQIGGVNQPYIAKLNSSFQVITTWAPAVNGAVRSIILNGTTVYIAGQFSQTNTVTRQYISALGTANPGANKTWNSSMSSYVYSLVSDGTSIYAGGQFATVNGSTTRNLLAKFDLNGNLDATWNPNAAGGGGTVEALAISGTNILAGGSFTTVGGNSRNYLAKLNNTNGAASNWATANSYVYALYVDGTTVYAGGYFTQLTSTGGTMTPRNYLGAIVVGNGNIGSFNPNPNSYVFGIKEVGSNLYYGGSFTQINGTDRKYLASSNTSGNLQSWNPSANYTARTLVVDGSNIFIGGDFTGFQEVERQRASIIRYNNQSLANWAPAIDNVVYDITANATKIFIGGAFHNVAGSSRNGLAAFNLKGNLQTTNLNLTKGGGTGVSVWSLFATATKLYAGGDFDQAGSDLRSDFVEADISSGAGNVLATDASPDDIVYAINVQGTNIVYGGNFGFSNLAKRNYLGLVRMSTGKILPFAPSPDSYVFDIAVNYNRIFIVGQFDNVNGTAHTGAAAFNKSTGALLTWNPQLARIGQSYYADLFAVAADSNNVYLGGAFDKVAGTTRNNAAVVAATNASLLAWDPEANNSSLNGWVRTIAMNGTNLLIGGDFNFCKGAQRYYVAKIDSATGLVNASWNPGANGYVWAITGSGSNIFIGGSFSQLAGLTRTSLGSVSASTGAATSFDPVIQSGGGQGTVYALAFDASSVLYVGGSFNTAKATARNNVAAFTTGGAGALQAWDPNAGSTVYALSAIGTKIFLGGAFTTLNNGGATRHYFGSVNNTNGTATNFDPDMNGAVICLANSGNNLYVGGQFSTVAGNTISRGYQALYDASTGALKTWNAAANSYVYGIAVQTDSVYSTGYFTTLNGNSRGYAGAVRGSAGTATLAVNPAMDYIGRSSFVSEHMWLIGGQFNVAGGDIRHGFAVYDLPGNAPLQSDNTTTEEYVRAAGSLSNQFTVYPNPAHGIVTLKLQEAVSGKLNITVTDMNGKKVLQHSEDGNYLNYIKLNTSSLKNGTYVITVSGSEINVNSIVVIAN